LDWSRFLRSRRFTPRPTASECAVLSAVICSFASQQSFLTECRRHHSGWRMHHLLQRIIWLNSDFAACSGDYRAYPACHTRSVRRYAYTVPMSAAHQHQISASRFYVRFWRLFDSFPESRSASTSGHSQKRTDRICSSSRNGRCSSHVHSAAVFFSLVFPGAHPKHDAPSC